MSTMTEPGRIAFTASSVTSTGGRRPGTWAVVITTSQRAMCELSSLLQRFGLLGAEGTGVAAFAASLRHRRQLDEATSERLDLFFGLGPDVVTAHDCSESVGRGDRLQTGDSGTQHEHLRRRRGSRCRHEEREVTAEGVGADERRFVAGDARLRAEHVHRLGPAEVRGRASRLIAVAPVDAR